MIVICALLLTFWCVAMLTQWPRSLVWWALTAVFCALVALIARTSL